MPDPGLTDLIAAHVLSGPYIEYDSDGHHADDFYRCGEKCKWTSNEGTVNRSAFAAHAAHVALVVEQHTNGRIAELEATIARVIEGAQMLVESFQRVERGGNHLYDASTHRCADNLALLLAEAQGPEHLRAALEGEQQ